MKRGTYFGISIMDKLLLLRYAIKAVDDNEKGTSVS